MTSPSCLFDGVSLGERAGDLTGIPESVWAWNRLAWLPLRLRERVSPIERADTIDLFWPSNDLTVYDRIVIKRRSTTLGHHRIRRLSCPDHSLFMSARGPSRRASALSCRSVQHAQRPYSRCSVQFSWSRRIPL